MTPKLRPDGASEITHSLLETVATEFQLGLALAELGNNGGNSGPLNIVAERNQVWESNETRLISTVSKPN